MSGDSHGPWIRDLRREKEYSDKNWGYAVLLSFLLGFLGADRFYLGYGWSSILKCVTLGGLGVWYLLDLVLLIMGTLPDAYGGKLRGPF